MLLLSSATQLLLSHTSAAGSPMRHHGAVPAYPSSIPLAQILTQKLLLNGFFEYLQSSVAGFCSVASFAMFRAQIKIQVLLLLTVCAPSPSVLFCPSTHSCLVVAVREKIS